MKISKPFLAKFVICFALATTMSSCKLGRFAYYNFANITDHKIFPARTAKTDSVKFYYVEAATPISPKATALNGTEIDFGDYLAENETVAFLIIHNDTIQYEKYFNGYERESVVASFSMAKSVTSILIGCALEDGYIKSIEEPIINYIPELKNDDVGKVTIKELLNMRSGIKFNES